MFIGLLVGVIILDSNGYLSLLPYLNAAFSFLSENVFVALIPLVGAVIFYYWNYFRVSKAIQTEGKKVNKEGAKYLREILTGQSHCVADADDDDSEK